MYMNINMIHIYIYTYVLVGNRHFRFTLAQPLNLWRIRRVLARLATLVWNRTFHTSMDWFKGKFTGKHHI